MTGIKNIYYKRQNLYYKKAQFQLACKQTKDTRKNQWREKNLI